MKLSPISYVEHSTKRFIRERKGRNEREGKEGWNGKTPEFLKP
jgi:hypothetical protein